MDTTELILICLVAVALLGIVARKISVPYPILLTVAGAGLALVPGLPVIHLEPKLVFDLFLPPLLYPAAVYTSWRDFRANLRSILPLATLLVLLTMVATACLFHTLTGLPLAVGFVFGALISPPDAVAALAALLPAAAEARVLDAFVTREPRATFRQRAGSARFRPEPGTASPRVVLAGAWTATGWPDTMEGAVRSGNTAADMLMSRRLEPNLLTETTA